MQHTTNTLHGITTPTYCTRWEHNTQQQPEHLNKWTQCTVYTVDTMDKVHTLDTLDKEKETRCNVNT